MPLFALYHKGNSERIYSRKDKPSDESFVPPIDRVSASNAIQARIKFVKKRKEKFSVFQEKYTVKKIGIPNSVDKKLFVKAFKEGKNPFQEAPFVPEVTTLEERKKKRREKLKQKVESKYDLDPVNPNANRVGIDDDEYVLERLPESYAPAKIEVNKSENCMSCVHWAARRCHKWEAPVKADYWCKSFEQGQVKLVRPEITEGELKPLDESIAVDALKLTPELQEKLDKEKEAVEKAINAERERGKKLGPLARRKRKREKRLEKLQKRKELLQKIENGTLTPEEANSPEVIAFKRKRKRDAARGPRFLNKDKERKRQSATPKTHSTKRGRRRKKLRYFGSKKELEGQKLLEAKKPIKPSAPRDTKVKLDTSRQTSDQYIARSSGPRTGGGGQSSGGGGGSSAY